MTINSLNRSLMTVLGFVRERHWCYTHLANFGKETIMDYKYEPWFIYDRFDPNVSNSVMVHQCKDCWNIL